MENLTLETVRQFEVLTVKKVATEIISFNSSKFFLLRVRSTLFS